MSMTKSFLFADSFLLQKVTMIDCQGSEGVGEGENCCDLLLFCFKPMEQMHGFPLFLLIPLKRKKRMKMLNEDRE